MVGCLVWQHGKTKGCREKETFFFSPACVFSLQGKQAELELKKEVRLRGGFFLGQCCWVVLDGGLGWVGEQRVKVKESKLGSFTN